MKSKIKSLIKKISLKHSLKSVYVDEDQHVRLSFKDMGMFLKKEVRVKDRTSGRRIQIPVNAGECTIPLQELAELTDNGKLDFYLISELGGRKLKQRISFNSNLKQVQHVDEEANSKFRIIKTVKNNLTIQLTKAIFKQEVKDIKVIGTNFYISGILEDLENKKPEKAEIIFQRRDYPRFVGFNVDLKKGQSKNKYQYDGIVYLDKFKNDMVMNSRWDAFLQLRDISNRVIYRHAINLQSYDDFTNEEDRYLVNIKKSGDIVSLYATMGLNSLALWYTDETQFQRTYQIAKGKTVFNKTAEEVPINDKMVFFESFFGKNYSGNPKYVYEQMLQDSHFKDFTFVWSYSGLNPEKLPGNPIIVDRETSEYYRYLAESKYWVSNIVFPVQKKREGNIYLQTWHGTPLKKLGFDIEIEGPETLARENFYLESRNWDYLIAANEYSSQIFRRAFKYEKEMIVDGYPANDIFYEKKEIQDKMAKEIKSAIGIPSDKKVILYAPTWRDNEMVGSWDHSFELKFDLDKFHQELSDEYVLVLRMHHLVGDALVIDDKYKSFVYDCSKYDDIQDLYRITDIIITDYSSVFFDYANTRKPILFYAYDFEMYKDDIRGFYLDMESELPGPVLKNDADLLDSIVHIEQVSNEYKDRYKQFHERFCGSENGNAGKKVIEKVFKS
jgi:CDP-glycerol glycerophosphotransferase (TagB/SpsB family)